MVRRGEDRRAVREPPYIAKHPHPLVNVYPIAGAGWKVFPSLVDPAHAAACKKMTLVYHGS